jgi:hypothetical protein
VREITDAMNASLKKVFPPDEHDDCAWCNDDHPKHAEAVEYIESLFRGDPIK